jgi:hypothetical protein
MKHEDFKTATRTISRSIDRSGRFAVPGAADFLLVGGRPHDFDFRQLTQLEWAQLRFAPTLTLSTSCVPVFFIT